MKTDGWIYDAYPENGQLTLWLKIEDNTLQLHDQFPAEIYATPRKRSINELTEILSHHPFVESTSICLRYLKITDEETSEVIRIAANAQNYQKLIWDLQATEICTLCNTDLSPTQRYFYSKRFENFGKFTVEYDDKYQVTQLSENDDTVTPKLNVLQVEPEDIEDTVKSKLTDEEFQILVIQKDQRPAIHQMLRDQTASTNHYSHLAPGKLIVDYENFRNLGVAGLDEKSKFANL